TSWTDINALSSRAKEALHDFIKSPFGRQANPHPGLPGLGTPARNASYYGGMASRLYQLLFNFPDKRIGWLPEARRRGLRLLKEWRPDVIFASAPPFTTFLIGYLLSRATGIPLIVEYRDRWSDDPYYPPPWWRHQLERWLEDRITRHAIAITT